MLQIAVSAIKRGFTNALKFSGRASRAEYWWLMLTMMIMCYVCIIALPELVIIILGLLTIVPVLSVGCRRLHDIGKSGWWQLLCLIPVIGTIILLVWFCKAGDTEANRFGERSPLVEQSNIQWLLPFLINLGLPYLMTTIQPMIMPGYGNDSSVSVAGSRQVVTTMTNGNIEEKTIAPDGSYSSVIKTPDGDVIGGGGGFDSKLALPGKNPTGTAAPTGEPVPASPTFAQAPKAAAPAPLPPVAQTEAPVPAPAAVMPTQPPVVAPVVQEMIAANGPNDAISQVPVHNAPMPVAQVPVTMPPPGSAPLKNVERTRYQALKNIEKQCNDGYKELTIQQRNQCACVATKTLAALSNEQAETYNKDATLPMDAAAREQLSNQCTVK